MKRNKINNNYRRKFYLLFGLLLVNLAAFSQAAELPVEKKGSPFPQWAFDPNSYLIIGLCTILFLTIYVMYRVNMALLQIVSPKPELPLKEIAEKAIKEYKPGMMRRMYLKMVDSVPVEKEKDVLLDHDYDGIKELDNNLPPWWKWGFYFTIVFAVIYLLYYHVSGVGKLQDAEYAEQIQIAADEKAARLLASADNVNEENVTALTSIEGITHGKETFEKLCAACHRTDGGGQVGPNLTDEYWLHGGGIKNVFKTITYGVPTKGMISWQSQLSPKQIQQVATYILTMKGTNPAGAKEAQGDVWIEQPVKSDSLPSTDSTQTLKTKSIAQLSTEKN